MDAFNLFYRIYQRATTVSVHQAGLDNAVKLRSMNANPALARTMGLVM